MAPNGPRKSSKPQVELAPQVGFGEPELEAVPVDEQELEDEEGS